MKDEITASLKGRFSYLKWQGENSTIIEVKTKKIDDIKGLVESIPLKDGMRFTVLGKNLPCESKSLDMIYYGKWVNNQKYGLQLQCSYYEVLPPETIQGIKMYLKSLKIKGVGTKTIQLLINEFGKETLEVCEKDPDRLKQLKGLSEKRIKSIHEAVANTAVYNRLAVFLGSYNVKPAQIKLIAEQMGGDAIQKIMANPYSILELSGIGFLTADQIAKGLGKMLSSKERIENAILYVLHIDSLNGNLYINKEELMAATLRVLNQGFHSPAVDETKFITVFSEMATKHKIIYRFKAVVYSVENEDAEKQPARVLERMLNQENDKASDLITAAQNLNQNAVPQLSVLQMAAVEKSLSHPVSIITGGAGTGKTSIVKSIIKAWKEVYPTSSVTLLAPTGKAARRMAESTGYPASTIHSALQIYPSEANGYSFEQRDLPEGLIVVDEFSMVDQYLMQNLMNHVIGKSTIVMVGDIHQLPSVSAGDVLNQMISSGEIPVSMLTETFRQVNGANSIIENAEKVKHSCPDFRYDSYFDLTSTISEEDAADKIISLFLSESKKWGMDNVMILTPLRKQTGKRIVCSEYLNKLIQSKINPAKSEDDIAKAGLSEFRLHDRVMQTKNKEFVSNGDIGRIVKISLEKDDEDDEGDEEKIITIEFENGNTLEYTEDDLADIELAYAITIHKSQGSEYKSVIIPILETQRSSFFSKNLLYTAITRAKQVCHIVNDNPFAIESCVKTQVQRRNTLFAKRLLSAKQYVKKV